jgi:hypothetical protein
MIIENDWYVGVIDRLRISNTHVSSRFRYVITRKRAPLMLMIAGFAGTEKEAAPRVQAYFYAFVANDVRKVG